LARKAATHLKWTHLNPDKVKEQQRLCATVPERKMKTIINSAKQRGIDVNLDEIAEMEAKLSLECEYCGFVPNKDNNESINGLDRVVSSSSLGYTNANTVPCCATCNAMKGPLDVDVFVWNVRNINTYLEFKFSRSFAADAPRVKMPPFSGRAELREAPKKKKSDFLTREEKIDLWSSPCYLCGRSLSFGIDRVDASGDYTTQNTKPCCTDCNYMKKDMRVCDFRTHVAFVDKKTRMWTLGDVADKPFKVLGGKTREPVAVWDDDGTRIVIIFPSLDMASRMIRVSQVAISRSIQNGTKCQGHRLTKVSAREYREQALDSEVKRRVLMFFASLPRSAISGK
jgi:hypothetical protein